MCSKCFLRQPEKKSFFLLGREDQAQLSRYKLSKFTFFFQWELRTFEWLQDSFNYFVHFYPAEYR